MNGEAAPADRTDSGSVLILTIGFALIVMVFVAVVVDASKLFLTRRALASVADGAALAAAQDVDVAAVYTGQPEAMLPLAPETVRRDVEAYVAHVAPSTGLSDLRVTQVTVGARDVAVTLSARSSLPLVGPFVADPEGTLITVTAHARAAVG